MISLGRAHGVLVLSRFHLVIGHVDGSLVALPLWVRNSLPASAPDASVSADKTESDIIPPMSWPDVLLVGPQLFNQLLMVSFSGCCAALTAP